MERRNLNSIWNVSTIFILFLGFVASPGIPLPGNRQSRATFCPSPPHVPRGPALPARPPLPSPRLPAAPAHSGPSLRTAGCGAQRPERRRRSAEPRPARAEARPSPSGPAQAEAGRLEAGRLEPGARVGGRYGAVRGGGAAGGAPRGSAGPRGCGVRWADPARRIPRRCARTAGWKPQRRRRSFWGVSRAFVSPGALTLLDLFWNIPID